MRIITRFVIVGQSAFRNKLNLSSVKDASIVHNCHGFAIVVSIPYGKHPQIEEEIIRQMSNTCRNYQNSGLKRNYKSYMKEKNIILYYFISKRYSALFYILCNVVIFDRIIQDFGISDYFIGEREWRQRGEFAR